MAVSFNVEISLKREVAGRRVGSVIFKGVATPAGINAVKRRFLELHERTELVTADRFKKTRSYFAKTFKVEKVYHQ